MEARDWIAVAQVYALLAQTQVEEAGLYMGTSLQERLHKANQYREMARTALRAAGIEDA